MKIFILAVFILLMTGCDKMANNALGKKAPTKQQCIYMLDGQILNNVKTLNFYDSHAILKLNDGTVISTGPANVKRICR